MHKVSKDEIDFIRQEAMEFAGIGFYRYKFDGTVLFIDRGALKILDLDKKFPHHHEVRGKNIAELINYIGPKGLLREKIRKYGHVKGFEYNFETLTGIKKWVIHDSYSVYDQMLKEDVIQVIIHEITDLKKAEEALAAEKERLSVTLRSIGDGVITTDINGNILLINKIAEKLTGWTQQEAIGKPLGEVFRIIDAKTRQECINPVERVLKSGERFLISNRTILISRQDTEIIISDSISPIFDRNSKIIGIVLVFRDITEQNYLEEELLKARKLESVGLLASGIAHDFNNILTGIMGNIALAMMYLDPREKAHEILIEAEKASLRARALTYQLLTFAKGGEPIKKVASIAELLKETTNFALSGANVKCNFSIPDDLWTVEIDTGQISQVINNMVINAKQAMPEGGNIEVSAANTLLEKKKKIPLNQGKYIKISIKDYGTGIDKENLTRIFDPYFSTKKEGSGLGLTTSYAIIKKHNGLITVDSKPGMGATFHIYLPACQEDFAFDEKEKDRIVEGKGKILLLDDEDTVRTVTGKILKRLGYYVEFAKDGQEAITKYKKAVESGMAFNTVIMDLTIPGGMGGKEAIQELLSLDPHIKAIVSSGYSTDPIMSDYRKYGFCGVIAKPYKLSELSEILHKIIYGTR